MSSSLGKYRWLPRDLLGWVIAVSLLPVAGLTLSRAFGLEVGVLAWLIAFTPYVAFIALACLLAAPLSRSIVVLTIAVTCVLLQLMWLVPLYRGTNVAYVNNGTTLTVMTSNLKVGAGDATAVVNLVKANDVGLLAIEELTPKATSDLAAAGLNQALGHRWMDPTEAGMGIWSKYPLTGSAEVNALSWPVIGRRVEVPGLPLTFVAVHPSAPLTPSHTLWTKDQPLLRKALDTITGPAIAAGDFNATLDHSIMRQLREDGYTDSAEAIGAGVNATWPEGSRRLPLPLFAIDHIMYRDISVHPRWARTELVPNSDHRALIVEFGQI